MEVELTTLNMLATQCRNANDTWWRDPKTGQKLEHRNTGELLMLCVTELSEAMEGHRKNLQDDKLPQHKMFDVELVDTLIRIFDMAGEYRIDLDTIFRDKMAFNAARADHKPAARLALGGKQY